MLVRHLKLAVFLSLTVVLLLPGCNDSNRRRRRNSGDSTQTGDISAVAERCQESLASGLSRVEPIKLGISTRSNTAAMGLNEWLRKCATDSWTDNWAEDVSGLLGEDLATRAAIRKFRDSDSLHIRTCFVLRSYAQVVSGDNERDRIRNLFYAIVRDVAETERDFPLTQFEILMSGRGTAKDRAWLFVSALRQLRIDACVLKPEGTDIEHIVGVVSNGDVLLFDAKLGLPVFKAEDEIQSAWPQSAVSLAEVDDETLANLSVDGHRYPVKADQLKNAEVLLVGGPGVWSQRSLVLQDALSGDQLATLCDPLQDLADAPGLVNRIKAAGEWEADRIKIWSWPMTQIQEFGRSDEADLKKQDQLMNPFKARVVRNKSEDGTRMIFSDPAWELFKSRVDQLQGIGDDAVPTRIQNIRLGKLERESDSGNGDGLMVRNPEEFVVLHNRAAEDAYIYLVAFLHREGDYQAAIDTVRHYKRDYYGENVPEDGAHWKLSRVNYLLALSHAANGEPGLAYKAMKAAVEADEGPEHGNDILLQRLKAVAGEMVTEEPQPASVDMPDKKDEEKDPGEKADKEKKDGTERSDGNEKKGDQQAV